MNKTENGTTWRSQSAFVIVAVGATLGLNDFLTFPVMAGQNGGGAFLLLYMLFLFILGMPLLMSELMLGRLTRTDPSASIRILSEKYKAPVYWKLSGLGAILAAFLIVATLSVIAGWSLAYAIKSAGGGFQAIDLANAKILFEGFITDAERMTLWHTLFVIALVAIISQPLCLGLERTSLLLVPLMVFLLLMALILALGSSGLQESIRFILYADFSAMDANTPILALQRAFYTLAIGVGVMVAFGRYLPSEVPIGYAAGMVIAIDLLFSVFTGLSINALMLSAGQEIGIDSQFAFRVMPVVFESFTASRLFSTAFYLLMTVAALTTSIALLEAPLTYLERKYQLGRVPAAIYLGIAIWLFGLGVVFAHSIWNGDGFTLALFFGDEAVRLINNAGFHDVLTFVSSHLLQPLAALCMCLFVAWKIPRETSYEAFALKHQYWFEMWDYLIRYIVPVLLIIVILAAFGVV